MKETEVVARDVEHDAVDLREQHQHRGLVVTLLVALQRAHHEAVPRQEDVAGRLVLTRQRDKRPDGILQVGHAVVPPTGEALVHGGLVVPGVPDLDGLDVAIAVRPAMRRSPPEPRELGRGAEPRDVRPVGVAVHLVEVTHVHA